jgi:hypothetical protein
MNNTLIVIAKQENEIQQLKTAEKIRETSRGAKIDYESGKVCAVVGVGL